MASSQCCENPPVLDPAGGEDKVFDSFSRLKAYLTGSDSAKAAVVLVSDVYRFESPNLRIYANGIVGNTGRKIVDKVASSGYFAVVPDFFHGDPFAPENAERPIQVWLKSHTPEYNSDPNLCIICYRISEVKCPISVLGAEIDKMSPPELVKQFEQVLSANSGVGHFIKIFPGVSHGWSVRYSPDDAAAVKSAEEALSDMIDWFSKNLK